MGSTTTVYIVDALLIESDVAPTKSIYILLVLRNEPVERFPCHVCKGLSTHYDGDGKYLCDAHEKNTSTDPEWRSELVNSPRMGESCFDGLDMICAHTLRMKKTLRTKVDSILEVTLVVIVMEAVQAVYLMVKTVQPMMKQAQPTKSRRREDGDDEESQSDSDNNEASMPKNGDKGGASHEDSSSE